MTIITLVIDSFGIGEAPDAAEYGDKGANTAVHTAEAAGKADWPVLKGMGLGNAAGIPGRSIPGCPPAVNPEASFAVLAEQSKGKDTTTGHWELAGIVLDKAFTTFQENYPSFPHELTDEFEKRTGRGILGNIAASGTQIIQDLGEEHLKTGRPIVYTSSDSVFQIAAHEEIIPVEKLYEFCKIARDLCNRYNVGRVIARPFTGKAGNFTRTPRRHDFSIALPGPTVLDHLQKNGIETIAVGKIGDIFNMQGIDITCPDKGNRACLDRTISLLKQKQEKDRFIFVNLVDTDMIFGHRRDPQGYHDAVAEIDYNLNEIKTLMKNKENNALIITADHGCDPTYRGTDHTREHVPFLLYRPGNTGKNLGNISGFSYMAKTVSRFFGIAEFP